MITGNFKMAKDAIKAAKWRSLLTMLGIIIGVVSVVTIVSIGEGVKQEVVRQINQFGPDLLTVRPGRTVTRDAHGDVSHVNLLATLGGGATFNESDLKAVQRASNVGVVVPLSVVAGVARADGQEFDSSTILGTTEGMPNILNQKVEFGSFFTSEEKDQNVAVIGKRVAEQLFHDNVPVGHSFEVRGKTFIVRGVFEEFSNTPLAPNSDYNYAIFIPFNAARALSGSQMQIQQILVKPASPSVTNSAADSIKSALRYLHGGQEDFTILRQSDNLAIAKSIITLLTGLITAVAAVSLIVGGIGIMNIMLVSITERTHEIGVRKAIGATTQQIVSQFLVEAAMLSFIGGLIGVAVSIFTNFGLRIFTNLHPVVTWQVVVVAVIVALIVGIFFGITPALKAARKDPIEALRQI